MISAKGRYTLRVMIGLAELRLFVLLQFLHNQVILFFRRNERRAGWICLRFEPK